MRILHVAASYFPAVRYGGTIVSVHGLCKTLAARGHDVHVFTTSVDGPIDSDVPLLKPVEMDGVRVWYFPSPALRRLYWSRPMAQALASQVGTFDIVHLHALFVWPVWAAARAARRAGVPYLVAPRGMLEKALIRKKNRVMKSVLMAAVGRRMLEGAAEIHVTSAREAAEARAFGFNLPPCIEVPNGVALPSSPAPPLSTALAVLVGEEPFVLFLGRISWKKGLDRLINALPLIKRARLVVAGGDEDGYQPALERTIATLGVQERVLFLGPVAGDDKAALLGSACALVLPSYSENFGNAVLEAMAAGCPVVVTPEVGLSSLVERSGAGVVVPGEPAQLAAALQDLLADPCRRREMGLRGRRIAAERFGWDRVAAEMEGVYARIVSRGGVRA